MLMEDIIKWTASSFNITGQKKISCEAMRQNM
jgi:hypothetical protein